MMCVNKGVFPALDRPGYLPGYRVLGTLFKTSFRTSCWQQRDIPACLLKTILQTEGHCNYYLTGGLIPITRCYNRQTANGQLTGCTLMSFDGR